MGRKLTYSERMQREREKKEKAAASRAETAARRAKEREQKENLANLQKDFGDAIVKLFNLLLESLSNLTLEGDIKKISAKDGLDIPNSISFKYPGNLTFSDLKSNLKKESFIPNPAIAKIKKNVNMKYESYKSSYGSFFGNLFGKTKKDYDSFIRQSSVDFKKISEKDKIRRKDFVEALCIYEEKLTNFNSKMNEELKIVNKNRLNSFDQIQTKIKDFNSSLSSFKREINKVFNSISEDGFDSLFGLSIPIYFNELDNYFDELVKRVKEFKKNSYASPSKNLKYGLSISNEKMHLFLVYNESYFPLPIEKQLNSVKNGYSIQSLTKANREKISKNLIPSAAILYAAYAFNTSKSVKDLILSIGKESKDKKTGSDIILWEHTLSIESSILFSLDFENIVPSESLKLFNSVSLEPFPSKIKWYTKKERAKQFNSKLQELNYQREEIKLIIEDFKKEKFSAKMPKELKKSLDRVNQIKG